MTSSAQQIRAYDGPAILSYGFRPFFLFAGVWTVLSMVLGILMFSDALALPTGFGAIDWHVHEQLYGYLPAVIAGFLLTAVPNWTGRLPVTGLRLLVLFLLWAVGRAAVLLSAYLGPIVTALLDLAFLAVFAFVIAREILSGKNWKNLKVLILVGLMAVGNATFHYEAAYLGAAATGYGARLGLAVAIILIMVVGGRIVPSFTRNWLKRQPISPPLPTPFDRFDTAAMIIGVLAVGLWVIRPDGAVTVWSCLLASALHFIRLGRWSGQHTAAERLVLILQVGYLFVPLGFLLVGAAAVWPQLLQPSSAVHAWTAGAVGIMTLAVMTRASLGHSGQPLTADRVTELSYAFVVLAVILRVASGAAIAPNWLIDLAGALWVLGFGLFVFKYLPLLALHRV